jgi:hypothetical protein
MNEKEEKLQRQTELGDAPLSADAEAYRFVFKALEEEPETELSSAFADNVMKIVEARKSKSSFYEMFWLLGGIVLLLISFVVAVVMTNFKFSMGFLSGMSSYAGLLIFGIVFIGLLNWIDKRFIHHNRSAF